MNYDSYRRFAFVIMTISFILIVSGSVSTFIIELKADKEETQKRVKVVQDKFEVFNNNTTAFEEYRDKLYEEVLGNMLYDTMYSSDDEIKNRLSNYEQLVDEAVKNVKELDKLCNNVYYPDKGANNICNNYSIIYEQINNYFVGDIRLYNANITRYNDYQKSLNSVLLINKYTTDKDFIDYNHDDKYEGKED